MFPQILPSPLRELNKTLPVLAVIAEIQCLKTGAIFCANRIVGLQDVQYSSNASPSSCHSLTVSLLLHRHAEGLAEIQDVGAGLQLNRQQVPIIFVA